MIKTEYNVDFDEPYDEIFGDGLVFKTLAEARKEFKRICDNDKASCRLVKTDIRCEKDAPNCGIVLHEKVLDSYLKKYNRIQY